MVFGLSLVLSPRYRPTRFDGTDENLGPLRYLVHPRYRGHLVSCRQGMDVVVTHDADELVAVDLVPIPVPPAFPFLADLLIHPPNHDHEAWWRRGWPPRRANPDPGGFASFAVPRGEVWILMLPALAREGRPFHGPHSLRLEIKIHIPTPKASSFPWNHQVVNIGKNL